MTQPPVVAVPEPLGLTPVDRASPSSSEADPRAPLSAPRANLIPPPSAVSPFRADELDDPQPRRRGRGMMIGGFAMFGGAYLSTNFMYGFVGGGDARLAMPMLGPLLVISEYEGVSAAVLGASAAVQLTGLTLGAAGAILHAREDRVLARGPRHGLGLMITGLSVFGASYAGGALLGVDWGARAYIPVAGPLIIAGESDADGFQGPLIATSLFQAAGLSMGIVGALRLGRARARVRAQAINADGVQITSSGLRVNVGPAPKLDGGVVRLTYRW